MALLITKCCVCGRIYKTEHVEIKDLGNNDERISHGYCSKDCSQAGVLQAFVMDENLHIFTGERAFTVNSKIYIKGTFLTSFISWCGNNYSMNIWNDSFYEEVDRIGCVNFADVKAHAKELNLTIIIA